MKERGNKRLKLLDKLVGIPLVYILGLLRLRKKLDPSILEREDPRIVLVKLGAIGDTILVTAVVAALRERFPRAHLTLLCTESNAPITESIVGLDSVRIIQFSKLLSSIREVNADGLFQLLFDFGSWPKINSFISYLIKAELKVGFKRPKMYRHYVYDLVVEHSDSVHECENYLNLLRAVGLSTNGHRPYLKASPESSQSIDPLLEDDKINVVVHPFSGGSRKMFKEWPLSCWVELCQRLIRKGCRVLISGGRGDLGQAETIASEIRDSKDQCEVIASKLTLDEMCALTRKADVVISVDTGIMHLAAATGANLVALHGPTSPSRWGPLSKNAAVVRPQKQCRPCLSLGFEHVCTTGGCMHTLSVDSVYDSAIDLVDRSELSTTRTTGKMTMYRRSEISEDKVGSLEGVAAG